MKTKLFAIVAILFSVALSSCIFLGPSIKGNGNVVEETRTVNDFTAIKASAGTNVYITQGNEIKVLVKADENLIDIISTKVEDGVLKITNSKQIRRSTVNKVFVTVREIKELTAFAGSNIYSETALKSENIELTSSAGSNMKLDVISKRMKVSTSAGSNIYLEGRTDKFEGAASAGSNIKAENLKTKICKAKVSSGANIWITVTDELDGKASSGGNVFYYGTPKQVDVSSSSGGNVKKR
jgi:hypothetical protein